MKAIVGLGNPGEKYRLTRHNAGFWLIDQIAEEAGVSVRRPEAQSLVGIATIGNDQVLLVKPQTFMNQSGVAVRDLFRKYGLGPGDLLLCYDDLALPPGTIRLRAKGSSGGHNGIQSVINYLGTQQFARLRIGIGPVPPGRSGADFVLAEPPPAERRALEAAIQLGAQAAYTWASNGIDLAMSRYNRAADHRSGA